MWHETKISLAVGILQLTPQFGLSTKLVCGSAQTWEIDKFKVVGR
jgi:hypothetical protein